MTFPTSCRVLQRQICETRPEGDELQDEAEQPPIKRNGTGVSGSATCKISKRAGRLTLHRDRQSLSASDSLGRCCDMYTQGGWWVVCMEEYGCSRGFGVKVRGSASAVTTKAGKTRPSTSQTAGGPDMGCVGKVRRTIGMLCVWCSPITSLGFLIFSDSELYNVGEPFTASSTLFTALSNIHNSTAGNCGCRYCRR